MKKKNVILTALLTVFLQSSYSTTVLAAAPCYDVAGSFNVADTRYLDIPRQPAKICFEDNIDSTLVTVRLLDFTNDLLGAFQAELISQSRCFDCLDQNLKTTAFYNPRYARAVPLITTADVTGQRNLRTRSIQAGVIKIGTANFRILSAQNE